jgi:O-antigen/teichoic acid export membrane protein
MMLLFTMDVIIVGVICGPDSAAVYGVLARLFGIVLNFLQAASEAAWPFIARGGPKQDFAHVLLRANAWIQSAVMGAMFVTLLPFLKWFMGEIWTASNPVFVLVAIRFFVMGLAAPANYALFGVGAFQKMARYFERELFAGCILSILLGSQFGLVGVAWGFLLATGFGTLLPVYRGFSSVFQSPLVGTVLSVWTRAFVGGAISCLTASILLHSYSAAGPQTVCIGAIAALATIAIAIILSCIRIRFSSTNGAKRMTLREIAKNM